MSRLRLDPVGLLALAGLALLVLVLTAPDAAPAAAQGVPTPTWRFDFVRQWSNPPPLGVFNHQPTGMAFDASGNLYVVDQGNHRVQVLDRQGITTLSLGHLGNGPGEFWFPYQVAVDSRGVVYVTDTYANRVVRFSPQGVPLPSWEGFEDPIGIGVGRDGAIYVSDNPGHYPDLHGRIQKLSADGLSRRTIVEANVGLKRLKVKRDFGADVIYIVTTGLFAPPMVLEYSAEGVLQGTVSDLALSDPVDLDVDNAGTLYVVDATENQVVVRGWRNNQQVTERWDGFRTPAGITLGPDGLLYVSDGEGGNFGTGRPTDMRIQRFTLQHQLVEPTWGSEEGHAPGQLVNPDAIAWDPAGYVWVHNNGDGRFQQFTAEGEFVRETPRLADFKGVGAMKVDADGNFLVGGLCRVYKLSPTGDVLQVFPGGEPLCITVGQNPRINFTNLWGFDLDAAGNFYGADVSNQRVVKLDRQGQLQKVYGSPNELNEPSDVAVDEHGDRIYVLDWREVPIAGVTNISTRIQVYRIGDGTIEDTWIVPNTDPKRPLDDAYISDIEVDHDGYVYAADVATRTIWKLEPVKGNPVARIEPGGRDVGPGQFDQLAGSWSALTLDPRGNLYTVEGVPNSRVQVFAQVSASVTPTVTATHSPSMTPSATATATPISSSPVTPSPSATMEEPGTTSTSTPTPSPSPTPSATITPTTTTVSSETLTATPTSPSATLTPTLTLTVTSTPSARDWTLFLPYVVR